MRIAFVIANAYGMGGTIRTVFNLAEGLARHHEVEIVSLVRHKAEPFFPVPEGVRLHALDTIGAAAEEQGAGPRRGGLAQAWWDRRARTVVPEAERERNKSYTAPAMAGLRRFLATSRADVVVGTRPGVNLLLSAWTPDRVLAVGQEHINLDEHGPELRAEITRRYPRLAGMTVLTSADRTAYRDLLGVEEDWLEVMPNPLPPRRLPRSTLDNPIIAAAGRLSPIKQYPKLLEAFSRVARAHPEWRLRIYGSGKAEDRLRSEIVRRGLSNQVHLMGRTKDITGELAKASLLAVSSRVEGFGMTIVEGFSVGVPAVSFDCPYGPREIISHGVDGLLVPAQDTEALGDALLRLVEDGAERERMGGQALLAAERYSLEGVVERWDAFLERRLTAAGRRPRALSASGGR